MASESLSLMLGRVCNIAARRPIAGQNELAFVSCKMRQRNLSSQRRRAKSKKVSPKRLPLKTNFQANDKSEKVEIVTKDTTINAALDTLSRSSADTDSITRTDQALTSAGEENSLIENTDSQQFRNVCLEDLITMIRNSEKNILLLNEARVRALEDFDKVLSEKETLQAEINKLGMKLAETDARIKVAALEKFEVELLENQLEKLKNGMSSRKSTDEENVGAYENTSKIQNSHFLPLNGNAFPHGEELTTLRKENHELLKKVEMLEACLEEINASKVSSNKSVHYNEQLQQPIKISEEQLHTSDKEMQSHVQLYQDSIKEFQNRNYKLEEEKKKAVGKPEDDMPWEFWSRLLLKIDGWLLEKKLSSNDAKLLREMSWKRDGQLRDTYLACKGKNEREAVRMFLKLILSPTRPGLNIVHIAAEMAPIAKVGGLGDVVCGLGKALQRKGHLVEIILPKYDCIQYESITDLKVLDVEIQSYFDGQLFKNKIWVGTVEGLPVYFVEPHHPAKFFWRGQFYGEDDDFKRFSFFSRAALEFLHQAAKTPDIIHCHDWQTAFVAPLYWDIYVAKGLNSARICFTCHNFEYQGTAAASELSSCGLDVHHLKRPDRMQDNSAHDKINPTKGAIVFSNIVTTVSPTYAREVLTAEGGRGLHETLNYHAKKFVGVLNGIDTDAWNPSTDAFLRSQYSADDLQGKAENKDALRKQLKLSSSDAFKPLVGCITRLVPQKGVHLIRHAIYRTLELGGQFLLLGSSPVPHIQREFEGIAKHFQSHPHVRLLLKYDEGLSHLIFAASDLFIVPSIFEPCGLTQLIAMRYGSVPIVRRTGGLNDTVFDIDDETHPSQVQNGFTFLKPDEEGLNGAMERAFDCYLNKREFWRQLVQKDMKMDFSWTSSAAEYENLYKKAVARAKAAAPRV